MRFKRKKKVDYYEIPMGTHIRRFLIDTGLPATVARSFHPSSVPMSEDVYEQELEASEERIARIGKLIPLLAAHSRVAAEAAVDSELARLNPEVRRDMPETFRESSVSALAETILRAATGSLAQFLDLGLLVMGTSATVNKNLKGHTHE
jgi:hypothetical protein